MFTFKPTSFSSPPVKRKGSFKSLLFGYRYIMKIHFVRLASCTLCLVHYVCHITPKVQSLRYGADSPSN